MHIALFNRTAQGKTKTIQMAGQLMGGIILCFSPHEVNIIVTGTPSVAVARSSSNILCQKPDKKGIGNDGVTFVEGCGCALASFSEEL